MGLLLLGPHLVVAEVHDVARPLGVRRGRRHLAGLPDLRPIGVARLEHSPQIREHLELLREVGLLPRRAVRRGRADGDRVLVERPVVERLVQLLPPHAREPVAQPDPVQAPRPHDRPDLRVERLGVRQAPLDLRLDGLVERPAFGGRGIELEPLHSSPCSAGSQALLWQPYIRVSEPNVSRILRA
ncbi:MAG: hypothetical protein IT374_00030 [Polyangiaceae bacterium]|nr:hypothetical protein [Polyangiaceae bacterium]